MEKEEEEDDQKDQKDQVSVLEMMNHQARLRRVGVAERRRRKVNPDTSDSMMVLNGSIATFETSEKKVQIGKGDSATPVKEKVFPTISGGGRSKIGQQQRLDVMATPMVSRRTASESIPLRTLASTGVSGRN